VPAGATLARTVHTMSAPACFRINSPAVVYQVFDDEVVIVDLGSGTYYSVDGVAADVWTRIEGATTDDIVDGLTARYRMPRRDIEAAVLPFLDALRSEGLIVPGQGDAGEDAQGSRRWTGDSASSPPRFDVPTLRKYSDMQELLLLDPIHDVDEVGWPTRPEGGPESSGEPRE